MADLSEGSNVSGHSAARAEAGCVGTEWQQNTETLNTRSRREKVAAKSDIFTINQITVGPGGHSFLTTSAVHIRPSSVILLTLCDTFHMSKNKLL